MYHSSCRTWFIYMGIFCIIVGFIFGSFISIGYGAPDLISIINGILLNNYSLFGYIFLSIGLILQYFKVKLHKREQKLKPQTQKYESFKDFVKDKINTEDKDSH
ncbi:MAG: hypothetical protein ACTSR7_12210 [Promethearchaeota archaeon]